MPGSTKLVMAKNSKQMPMTAAPDHLQRSANVVHIIAYAVCLNMPLTVLHQQHCFRDVAAGSTTCATLTGAMAEQMVEAGEQTHHGYRGSRMCSEAQDKTIAVLDCSDYSNSESPCSGMP